MFVLTIGLFSASIPAYHDWLINFAGRGLDPATVRTNLKAAGISIDSYARYELSISVTSAIVCSAVSMVIFWRRSDDWMALVTSLGLLAFGVFFLTDGPTALVQHYPAVWLPVNLLAFLGSMSFILFLYLFPSGRFVPGWTRWLPILWAMHEVAYYFFPNSIFSINTTLPLLEFLVSTAFACIGVSAQIYRYRHVSGPAERQQTKWVVFGIVLALLGVLAIKLPLNIFPTFTNFGSPGALAFEAAVAGFLLLIPLSIGFAILRYHLWHIDIIINRTLVYGSLSVMLTAVFTSTSALLQYLFFLITGVGQTGVATIVSVIVISVTLRPVYQRVDGVVNRLLRSGGAETRETR